MRNFIHLILIKLFKFTVLFKHPELRNAYSITSHLTEKERYVLFNLAKEKKTILEIGSYVGASAACFGAAVKDSGKCKIYCIDTWNNDAMTEGKKETYQLFMENIKPFQKDIVPVRGFSTEVIEQISGSTDHLDLLFIDGDHSYEGVKADWESYKSFLRKGSIVVFHDFGWAEGVKRVIMEDVIPIVSNHKNLPNMWWATIA